jgi:hypothetical protein
MTDPLDLLLAELKRLRRGRGVQTPAIDSQVGPELRRHCGIEDTDGAGVIREKLTDWVSDLTGDFPADLKLAVTTGLGMNPDAQHRFHTERVSWLAAQAGRDNRTIVRRINDALIRLCEAAQMPQPRTKADFGDEWHLRRFNALLRMDGVTPVCHEVRTVVANKDGVERIPWSITLPRASDEAPPDLDIEVLRGVVLTHVDRPSSRRFLLNLQLPSPLTAGQTHEFALQVRVPRGQPMRPTYVFWPERRCERFELVIRFATDRPPTSVWRVDNAFHRDADDIDPGPDMLTVNDVGEVQATFTELRPNRGYGIQWRF